MSINTYATLVSAATEWLARDQDTTLVARIPDFITLAEAKLNRLLNHPGMETTATSTVDLGGGSPEIIALPTDFQTMRSVRLARVAGKPRLLFVAKAHLDDYRFILNNASAQPVYYTIFGTNIEMAPTPVLAHTVGVSYRRTIPALTVSNTTNWLLTLAPDLYLYGMLLEASPYLKNDERIAIWMAGFTSTLEALNKIGARQSYDVESTNGLTDSAPSEATSPAPQ